MTSSNFKKLNLEADRIVLNESLMNHAEKNLQFWLLGLYKNRLSKKLW